MMRRFAAMSVVTILLASVISATAADDAHAEVAASARTDAQALLNSGLVTFGNPEPEAQIRSYAAGSRRVNPTTGRYCNLNSVLLGALARVVVNDRIAISIVSLNRWCEGIEAANWYNYHSVSKGGHAVDVIRVDGVRSTGGTPEDLRFINAMTRALPTPAGLGQMTCAGQNVTVPPGWVRFPDGCDHVHIEYRGSDPLAEPVPTPIVSRDYSADGASDLLAIRNDGRLALYHGNGRGGFASGSGAIIGISWQSMRIVTGGADYTGDRLADLYAIHTNGNLYLYPGRAGGGVASGTYVGPGWGAMVHVIGGGDYNDDGYPDLLSIDRDGRLFLYAGNGRGGFSRVVQVGMGWSIFPRVVGGADFDGDGKPDLYGIDPAGDLWFYKGRINTRFDARTKRGNGWNTISLVSGGADLTGDGKGELFGRDSSGRLLMWPATNGGSFASAVRFGQGWEQMSLLP